MGGYNSSQQHQFKFKVGDFVFGEDTQGNQFTRARIKTIIGYAMADELETYEIEVLRFGGGSRIAYAKDTKIELFRDTVVMQPKRLEGANVLRALVIGDKAFKIKTTDASKLRKMQPIGTVLKSYFPLGFRGVAAVSFVGNEKHNPGEELVWSRGKSDDHLDCAARHLSESEDWDVTVLPDGRAFAVLHAAQAAWRALALAQLAAEKYGGEVIRELELPQPGETRQDRP